MKARVQRKAKLNQPTCVIASARPWNRGLAARVAKRTGIKVVSISSPDELTAVHLKRINPSYVFFPHWSHIIRADIFDAFECVIFHMTDLPFGRGGSPLQNLIVRGHDRTKISALKCVRELDAGPIYMKRDLSLQGTAEEIFIRADLVIEEMIVDVLTKKPKPKPQKGRVTTFQRRKPDQSNLDEAKSLDQAYDMIRMLDADGYPPAFLEVGPFRLEFKRASRKTSSLEAAVHITLLK